MNIVRCEACRHFRNNKKGMSDRQNYLSSCLLCKNVKSKMCIAVLVVLYGCETLSQPYGKNID
jgi:hypothetical protein